MRATWVCRACGAPVPVGLAACAYCGAVVEQAPPPPPPVAVAAAASRVRTYCPECGRFHAGEGGPCPRCPPAPAEAGPAPGARCPACAGDLRATALGGVTVGRCDACGGTWFDRGTVGLVLDLRTRGGLDREGARRLEAHFAAGVPPRDLRPALPCPRCRGPMIRGLVASKGPAFVDVCATHGVWFDAGEWEAFVAFVGAGGLEVEREREERGVRARPVPHDFSEDPWEERIRRHG